MFENLDDIELQIELDERLLIKSNLKHVFSKEYEKQEINLLLPNRELISDLKNNLLANRHVEDTVENAKELISTNKINRNDSKIQIKDEQADIVQVESIDNTELCQYDILDTFKCKKCPLFFDDKNTMLDHYNVKHLDKTMSHVILVDTSEPTNYSKLTKSMLLTPSPKCIVIENAPLFKCESCKAEFIEEGIYSHHMKENHENDVNSSKIESKERAVDEKLNSYFKKQDDSSTTRSQRKRGKLKKPVLKNFRERNLRCGMFGCHLKFSSKECLRRHQSCHDFQSYSKTNYICFICQMEFPKWNGCCSHLWNEHGLDVDILHCNFCESFKATTMHQMSMHQQIHSEDKPFVCRICDSSFKQRSLLFNHEHTHENQEEKKISTWLQKTLCNVCNKWFSCYRSYLQHYETIHNKVTNYSCPECKYETYRKSRLAEHMRTHNNPTAYTCEICKFSCADHNAIRRHRLKHLSSKHLRCPAHNCSLQTVYATFFRKHMKKKHSGQELSYGCQFCSFTTSQMERYISHCSEHEKAMVSELLNNRKRKIEDSTFVGDSRESFTNNSTEESDESLSSFDNHFFLKKI